MDTILVIVGTVVMVAALATFLALRHGRNVLLIDLSIENLADKNVQSALLSTDFISSLSLGLATILVIVAFALPPEAGVLCAICAGCVWAIGLWRAANALWPAVVVFRKQQELEKAKNDH